MSRHNGHNYYLEAMKYYLIVFSVFVFLACNATPEPVSADPPPVSLVDEAETEQLAQDRFVIDHYAIIVADLERSATFYQEVMGLKEVYDATEKDHIRWFDLGPRLALHIIEDADNEQVVTGKKVHLALTMNKFEAFVEKMRDLEYPFENWSGEAGTTNLRPDGVSQIYLADPDGYWIEINDAANF